MEAGSQPLSADQLREQLRAERLLADMLWMEELAELHESEVDPKFGQEFSDRYRRVLGVEPKLRGKFRNGLERILHDSGESVEEIIRSLGSP